MGVAIYAMLTGGFPFCCADLKPRTVRRALRDMKRPVWFSDYDEVSDEAVDLIRRLLTFDKHKRIASAAEALSHPWFQESVPASPTPVEQPKELSLPQSPKSSKAGSDTAETAPSTRPTLSECDCVSVSPAQPARPGPHAPLPSHSPTSHCRHDNRVRPNRPAAGRRHGVCPSGQGHAIWVPKATPTDQPAPTGPQKTPRRRRRRRRGRRGRRQCHPQQPVAQMRWQPVKQAARSSSGLT